MVRSTVLVVNSRPVIFKDFEQTDRLVFLSLRVAEADDGQSLVSTTFLDNIDRLVHHHSANFIAALL